MKTLDELAKEYSQKEWDAYTKTLINGSNHLHVRTFMRLGFKAGHASRDEEVKKLIEDVETWKSRAEINGKKAFEYMDQIR
jgi:hypothetical protein